jgi:hypothetical protein
MRIRTIKPEFFKDEQLAELSAYARLLFIGLWCLADRDGRLEDRPKRIEAEILPYDFQDVDALLQELADHEEHFIIRYEVDGKKIIQVRTFLKHQRLTSKETDTASLLPECEALGKQRGNNGEASGAYPGHTQNISRAYPGSTQETPEVPPEEKPSKPPENIDKLDGEALGKQRGNNGEASGAYPGHIRVIPGITGREGKGKEGEGGSLDLPPPPDGLLSQVKWIKSIRKEFEALRDVDIENALAGCPDEEARKAGMSDFGRDMIGALELPPIPTKKLRGYLYRAEKDAAKTTPAAGGGPTPGIENLTAEELVERANDAVARTGVAPGAMPVTKGI